MRKIIYNGPNEGPYTFRGFMTLMKRIPESKLIKKLLTLTKKSSGRNGLLEI